MSEAEALYIRENKPFPNSTLPVLVYRSALQEGKPAFDRLFKQNGWTGVWVNGVYGFHHFHAEAHEALGCLSGKARLMLGGPDGLAVDIRAGDALLLPAGTGHCLLSCSHDFSIAGAYPKGQRPDLQEGSPSDYERLKAFARAVPLPASDPVLGGSGAASGAWR